MRVSIVIPVYNEAERIGDCLRAIAKQTVQPYEVIVVDNNSTDASATIASQFPFVTLVREQRQGVTHARRRGFNEAHGAIIGSIDADTDIPVDWVWTVQQIFTEAGIDAVAGIVRYRDIGLSNVVSRVDLGLRRYFAHLYPDTVPLQGANMAVRREAWVAVRDSLCVQPGTHEDLDLAVHLSAEGWRARFDESLTAEIGSRQCMMDWRNFGIYAAANPRSYSRHGFRTRSMWCAVMLVVPLYPILRFLHQGYDADRQKFSWTTLLKGDAVTRVNPVTFVE